MSHFSKILKQDNASTWAFYFSNIIGWILTPRSLIKPGDVINIYICIYIYITFSPKLYINIVFYPYY